MKHNLLNNILWNIEISYNKQNIVFYSISQLACYIRIKMFCHSKLWNACWQRGLSVHLHRTIGRVGTVCNTFCTSCSFSETICLWKYILYILYILTIFALESQNFNTIKPYQSATHPHCCNTCTHDYIHTIYTWIDKIKCCNWHHKWGRLQQSAGQLQHSLKCN